MTLLIRYGQKILKKTIISFNCCPKKYNKTNNKIKNYV